MGMYFFVANVLVLAPHQTVPKLSWPHFTVIGIDSCILADTKELNRASWNRGSIKASQLISKQLLTSKFQFFNLGKVKGSYVWEMTNISALPKKKPPLTLKDPDFLVS